MSGAITAEERAEVLLAKGYDNGWIGDHGIDYPASLMEAIAAAIRAAEAAALERAAGVADAIERQAVGGEGCVGGAFFDRITAHAIAHGIRSLKSDGSGK
jgi:hypothetical protein